MNISSRPAALAIALATFAGTITLGVVTASAASAASDTCGGQLSDWELLDVTATYTGNGGTFELLGNTITQIPAGHDTPEDVTFTFEAESIQGAYTFYNDMGEPVGRGLATLNSPVCAASGTAVTSATATVELDGNLFSQGPVARVIP